MHITFLGIYAKIIPVHTITSNAWEGMFEISEIYLLVLTAVGRNNQLIFSFMKIV